MHAHMYSVFAATSKQQQQQNVHYMRDPSPAKHNFIGHIFGGKCSCLRKKNWQTETYYANECRTQTHALAVLWGVSANICAYNVEIGSNCACVWPCVVWCGFEGVCVARADNSCTVDLPACLLGKLSASHMPSADHHHLQQQQQQHCCYRLCNANALPDTISALFGP